MSNIFLLDASACCGGFFGCIWWLLWTLGAFALGALAYWWLFCRGKQARIDELTRENEGLHAQTVNLEKDLASLKYQIDEATKDNQALRAALSKCESDKAVLITKAGGDGGTTPIGVVSTPPTSRGTDYAALLGTDNHQIIEGIGPKIDGLMKAAGIANWADMAGSSVERLQKVLDDAGSRYRLADPKSWPRQAQLAHEGKWDELIEYQKFLDTGVETKGDFQTPSKVEKLIVKLLGFSTNPEDLKVVEGIGPKIEGLCKEAGIKNWSDLAAANIDQLKDILTAAGDRYKLADPSTWAKQASLAAAGDWDALKEYQDFLDGGKAPK